MDETKSPLPGQKEVTPDEKAVGDEVIKRAPTLYVIIFFKLFKGVLALLLAFGVYKMAGSDLQALFERLVRWVHLDPEKKFFVDIGTRLDEITPANVRWVAISTLLYSLFSLVEGIGLIFRVPWAGWLAIGESAFFIPVEVYELVHRKFSSTVLIILCFNIFIVWYLFQNRHRLFRHHHHH